MTEKLEFRCLLYVFFSLYCTNGSSVKFSRHQNSYKNSLAGIEYRIFCMGRKEGGRVSKIPPPPKKKEIQYWWILISVRCTGQFGSHQIFWLGSLAVHKKANQSQPTKSSSIWGAGWGDEGEIKGYILSKFFKLNSLFTMADMCGTGSAPMMGFKRNS